MKELVLKAWQERKAEVTREANDTDRRAKTIQQKLDRLDQAFLFARSIDITTYERQRDRLRQELTLTDIDRHSAAVEKIDVEGILAFAERVLPRASDLWVQASLNQRQRLQQPFFPDGIAFDGKQFVRTGVTANAFNYLTAVDSSQNNLASPGGFEPPAFRLGGGCSLQLSYGDAGDPRLDRQPSVSAPPRLHRDQPTAGSRPAPGSRLPAPGSWLPTLGS